MSLIKTLKWGGMSWSQRKQNIKVKRRLLRGHFDEQAIRSAMRWYVWPDSTNADPAEHAEPAFSLGSPRESLRVVVDRFLQIGDSQRHLLLLAGSGIGKTAFLLNYFVDSASSDRNVALVHLGSPDADERVKAIDNQTDTILFLDAFDEDMKAITDHRKRTTVLASGRSGAYVGFAHGQVDADCRLCVGGDPVIRNRNQLWNDGYSDADGDRIGGALVNSY